MDTNYNIIIADDHPLLRQGLVQLLSAHTYIKVIGEASNGAEALELIKTKQPDLAILDIQMPVLDGYKVAETVVRDYPKTRIVILSMFMEEDFVRNLMDLGIKGYILKESALYDVVKCIEAVMRDEYFVSPEISRVLMTRPKAADNNPGLTSTEKQIIKMIAKGKSSKEIAEELFKSPKTIENHRNNICKKLGITGNSALLKYALRMSAEE